MNKKKLHIKMEYLDIVGVLHKKSPARRSDWFDDECRLSLDAKNVARTT